ncbi:MAG TPA: pyroglutamyl-peptidase I [Chloroflexi bacterium]|nr:pyroglutamyl-peptidase I [Chloroflexota bacterium]
MKILFTAFEPYGKRTMNTSQEVLVRLSRIGSSCEIVKQLLPVDTVKAPVTLLDLLQKGRYQAVICMGEASSIRWVQLERLAVNWLDFPIPDNTGAQIVDQMIAPGGPAAYFSSLPIRNFESVVKEREIPVRISMSAGTYLCNQIFYTLMHFLHEEAMNIPGGFIHLPVYAWNHKEGEADVACGHAEYTQIAAVIEDMAATLVEN